LKKSHLGKIMSKNITISEIVGPAKTSKMSALNNAQLYEKNAVAARFTPAAKRDAALPFTANDGRTDSWTYEKAQKAAAEGKFIPRLRPKPDGSKTSSKLAGSQIKKNIEDNSYVYLDRVPREVFSRDGLMELFGARNPESSIGSFLQYYGSVITEGMKSVGLGGQNVPSPEQALDVVVNQIMDDMASMDPSPGNANYEAFISDPGFVNVRLVGDINPMPIPDEIGAFIEMVRNIKNYPLVAFLVSTGIGGGTSNIGLLYKCWMAASIIRIYGYHRLNYNFDDIKSKIASIENYSGDKKARKVSKYSVWEYENISRYLSSGKVLPALDNGFVIEDISNLRVAMPRPEFVKLVVEQAAKSGSFIDDNSVRINISGFPKDINIAEKRVKVYQNAQDKFVTLSSFRITLEDGSTMVVPDGLLIVEPEKMYTSDGSVRGGKKAIMTALIALKSVTSMKDAESHAKRYEPSLNELARRKTGCKEKTKTSNKVQVDAFGKPTIEGQQSQFGGFGSESASSSVFGGPGTSSVFSSSTFGAF
jgi:hypothetical protein